MKEFTRVRQDAGGFKRLFTDRELDLYVWYRAAGSEVTGFQLVYDKDGTPRAFTWLRGAGYRHDRVTGHDGWRRNRTPVLAADGAFDGRGLAARVRALAQGMEPSLLELICSALEGSDPGRENRSI